MAAIVSSFCYALHHIQQTHGRLPFPTLELDSHRWREEKRPTYLEYKVPPPPILLFFRVTNPPILLFPPPLPPPSSQPQTNTLPPPLSLSSSLNGRRRPPCAQPENGRGGGRLGTTSNSAPLPTLLPPFWPSPKKNPTHF